VTTFPTTPLGDTTSVVEVVASFATLEEAEARARALRRRSGRRSAVFVAARGLRRAGADEPVPPVSVPVALGAASSAIGAALVVGLFGALDPTISLLGVLALAFYALVFGAVGGALMGGLFYGVRTRHGEPVEPVETFSADRFDVLVEDLGPQG
jgi:hypothetical protein